MHTGKCHADADADVDADANADANGIRTKNNISPSASVGDIITTNSIRLRRSENIVLLDISSIHVFVSVRVNWRDENELTLTGVVLCKERYPIMQ